MLFQVVRQSQDGALINCLIPLRNSIPIVYLAPAASERDLYLSILQSGLLAMLNTGLCPRPIFIAFSTDPCYR
jgi:hypothetical protein